MFRPFVPLVFVSSLAATHALQPAQLVPQSDISKRVTYNGGWALGLAGASCPSDAPVACDTGSGSINPIWNMYTQGGGNYFCCEPGQYGVLPQHGYAGLCEPLDQAVASSLIATPASQAGGAAVTTVGSQTGGGAQSTMTVTSTLPNGGGVTTITTAVSGAPATSTQPAAATGTGLNSSGGGTATITLTKGAEIGIACGAAVILIVSGILLWFFIRRRKRKQVATNNERYGYPSGPAGQGMAMGPAPMYSSTPQQMGQTQGQQPYVVSPVQEYKTPVVGVMPQYGSPTPPPPSSAGGFSPPPQHQHQHQQGMYNGSPSPNPNQMHEMYEAPSRPPPVEAPNSWERGI
ncbi:hypothetical protein EG329_003703 [Mollisiaceae sp. DMI_Dod_QoI]|nr:hypothetical protein EG329_003703 [Helotiales sp. DMI_Dod_QoI]